LEHADKLQKGSPALCNMHMHTYHGPHHVAEKSTTQAATVPNPFFSLMTLVKCSGDVTEMTRVILSVLKTSGFY